MDTIFIIYYSPFCGVWQVYYLSWRSNKNLVHQHLQHVQYDCLLGLFYLEVWIASADPWGCRLVHHSAYPSHFATSISLASSPASTCPFLFSSSFQASSLLWRHPSAIAIDYYLTDLATFYYFYYLYHLLHIFLDYCYYYSLLLYYVYYYCFDCRYWHYYY